MPKSASKKHLIDDQKLTEDTMIAAYTGYGMESLAERLYLLAKKRIPGRFPDTTATEKEDYAIGAAFYCIERVGKFKRPNKKGGGAFAFFTLVITNYCNWKLSVISRRKINIRTNKKKISNWHYGAPEDDDAARIYEDIEHEEKEL